MIQDKSGFNINSMHRAYQVSNQRPSTQATTMDYAMSTHPYPALARYSPNACNGYTHVLLVATPVGLIRRLDCSGPAIQAGRLGREAIVAERHVLAGFGRAGALTWGSAVAERARVRLRIGQSDGGVSPGPRARCGGLRATKHGVWHACYDRTAACDQTGVRRMYTRVKKGDDRFSDRGQAAKLSVPRCMCWALLSYVLLARVVVVAILRQYDVMTVSQCKTGLLLLLPMWRLLPSTMR